MSSLEVGEKQEPKPDQPLDDASNPRTKDDPKPLVEGDLKNEKSKKKKHKSPKKKGPRWITRAMAEDISREAILLSTFKEMLVYVFFVIFSTIAVVGARSVSMFFLTEALKGQFLETAFQTVNSGIQIKYPDIRTPSDFFQYAENLMLDALYWENYYSDTDPIAPAAEDDKKILYENRLLGVPRLRQVKVKSDSCMIHEYFRRLFLHCYDSYSKSAIDKETFGVGTETALLQQRTTKLELHRYAFRPLLEAHQCGGIRVRRSDEEAVREIKWVWSSQKETRSIRFVGKITTYDGSGFYVDLKPTKNESLAVIKSLKDGLWITRGTRAIFMDFSVYNANLNLFCVCKLVFEFPPTGGIIPSSSFRTVHLLKFVYTWDYVVFTCEAIMYTFMVFYIMEELREVVYFKLRYFKQFWTYIDLLVIALAITSLIHYIFILLRVESDVNKIKDHPEQYGNLEHLGFQQVTYSNLSAALIFFIYVKIFKYLNFNKTMGQLNNTLKRCAYDVLGFSIMFFIIFFAFAELGYLLFGSEVQGFSSFGVAMFTLLRTILGDFDYNAIAEANRFLAPLFFLSYIFFVFFVLLNMFLAIINDSYADVKTEIAIAPDEMQMTQFIKRGFFDLFKKCGYKKSDQSKATEADATIQEIRDALKKCGFTDLEIEMFFARYNIDPRAEVKEVDFKKLMADLEAAGKGEGDFVSRDDFSAQQEKLREIEEIIGNLSSSINELIVKLEVLERRRQ